MFFAFFISIALSFGSVILVPKEGAVPVPKRQVLEEASEARSSEPDVVLRKSKKDRVVQSNGKKKKKSKKEELESAEKMEDLEEVYRQEKEFLESSENMHFENTNEILPIQDSEEPSQRKIASPSSESQFPKLKKIVEKYKTTHFVSIELQKEVTQELLERTKNYKGNLYLSAPGRFKLELKEPQKSLLVVNDKNVWMVDYPVDEAQNKVQILRSDKPEKLKSQGLLALLTGHKSVSDIFDIQNITNIKNKETSKEAKPSVNANEVTYKLVPKKKNRGLPHVELSVDTEKELIKKIVYWDDIGNKTTFSFYQHSFSEESPRGYFEFKPPSNASITDL